MAQSVRITNDKENRQEFKTRQLQRMKAALTLKENQESEKEVFLLPGNYEDYQERELFLIMTRTPELAYTNDSAARALNILFHGEQAKAEFKVLDHLVLDSAFIRENPVQPKSRIQPDLPEIEEVAVWIPSNFSQLKPSEQKTFLTKDAKLSPEKADDFIVGFNGGSVSGKYFFTIWTLEPEAPERNIPEKVVTTTKTPESFSIVLPDNYASLSGNELYMLLTRDAKFTCSNETALKVLDHVFQGIESDVTPILGNGEVVKPFSKIEEEHQTEVKALLETKVLNVPFQFSGFRPYDKYLFLQSDLGLTPEQAQAVLNDEIFDHVKFEIVIGSEAPESENPITVYLTEREVAKAEFNRKIQSSIKIPNIEKIVQSQPKVEIETKIVSVPASCDNLYMFLQTQKNLTPEQATAAILGEIVNNTRFEIQFEEKILVEGNPMEDYVAKRLAAKEAFNARIAAGVLPSKRVPEAKPPVQPEPVVVQAVLPIAFGSMKPRDQFMYLTTQLQWLPDQAHELVAHLSGQPTTVRFEVEFKESV